MPQVGFIYHDKFLDHETGHSHPENSHRLRTVFKYIEEAELDDVVSWIEAKPSPESDLLINHTSGYIDYVKKNCENNSSALLDDGDTRVCDKSFEVALLAVGATIQAVDLVHQNSFKRVFVGARPPGHHALKDHAMGFCLFNNIAIAAKYAREKLGYNRVMIFDWDVHHGNGTQDSFYEDPNVLVVNMHQFPFYPGGGSSEEIGRGVGERFNVNIPLGEGTEMNQYREAIKNVVFPTAEAFSPELLLVSAGFDAHIQDPLANMCLQDEDFYELTRLTAEIADHYCGGKLVSILEGGYHREALARSVVQHLTALSAEEEQPIN